jgi:predicted RNA-binding protein associated with RNAse of E/G family
MSDGDTIQSWSDTVAGLAVDRLVDHGLVAREDFDRATRVIAEEILVRLAMEDYPPKKTR